MSVNETICSNDVLPPIRRLAITSINTGVS